MNHPHICTIHGLEDLGGQPAIVMELVEGETLATRLAKSPLGLNQSLALAIQIAGALAEAHRRGVVHRDLKPANIMLTKSGAKVLDFGLAKIERAAAVSSGAETVTQKGAIVGTLHYMSPEQAQGKETDARSDIFSFGLVLYEMLTGRSAFEGESAANVMAGILEHEPQLPESNVPPALSRLLLRCLAKNPEERWQSARDLEMALEWATEAAPQLRPSGRSGAGWLAAALFAALAAVTLIIHLREKPPEQRALRLQIPPPGNDRFVGNDTVAISPDGTRIVFSAGGGRMLFVRSLDSLATQELPGTQRGHQPFWSPNGSYVAFFADGKLKKTSILGGPPMALCDAAGTWSGGAWNRDGVIVFAPTARSPLMQISADGGTPVPVTRLDVARGETSHAWPSFLPDNKHFLFAVHASEPAADGVFIGSLDSPKVTRLLPEETNAQHTEPGYILFSRDGSLMAQRFDSERLRFTGDPFLLAEGVSGDRPFPTPFSVSDGVLAYRADGRGGPKRLRWFDRNGNQLGDVGPAGRYREPALSPDGHALAVAMKATSRWDIWVFDLVRGINSRLTSGRRNHAYPSWSPDGQQIAFSFDRDPLWVVHRVTANGAGNEQLVVQLDSSAVLSQWTRNGQYLIMDSNSFGKSPKAIWAEPMSEGGKPFPVVTGPFGYGKGSVSPDGKWIAYIGDETGRWEVYVQEFPPKGVKSQISTAGGDEPKWRADGRELFYREGSKVVSVEVKTNARKLEAGIPKPLFDVPGSTDFDISADGQKFLVVVPNEDPDSPQPFTVVTNWLAGIKR